MGDEKVVKLTKELIDKGPKDDWAHIKEELCDVVEYVNNQLEDLDKRMQGADFQRSVYEARYWLLSQKVSALNSLMKLNIELKKMEEKERDEAEIDSLADLFGSKS